MYGYHVVAAILGTVLGLISYVPYYRDIFNRSIKPHFFTWFIWAILTGITASIQFATGGGVGAMVAAVESICCTGVAIAAFFWGEKDITKSDWACLILALIAIFLWLVINQPLLSILFVVSADLLGFIPTFRKSFWRPHEENASQFGISASHWLVSIFALESLAFVEWFYPAAIAAMDVALVAMLLIRRRQLDQNS
ncbi:MAG TPA: hypothetical protein VJL57_00300 [Candidatus Paceibacterota bacterium]